MENLVCLVLHSKIEQILKIVDIHPIIAVHKAEIITLCLSHTLVARGGGSAVGRHADNAQAPIGSGIVLGYSACVIRRTVIDTQHLYLSESLP